MMTECKCCRSMGKWLTILRRYVPDSEWKCPECGESVPENREDD